MSSLAPIALLLTTVGAGATPPASAHRVEGTTRLHLAVVLSPSDMPGLRAFLESQRDPRSPSYRRFLTPTTFGERFGQPAALYDAAVDWLATGGLSVERFPNHLFVGASGTSAQVEALLDLELQTTTDGQGRSFRRPSRAPTLPPALAPFVLAVDGLDTRPRFHPRLEDSSSNADLGPQDLRRFYDIDPLLARGVTGRGAALAVLGPQVPPSDMPSGDEIGFFLGNVSNSATPVVMDILPNPANDLSTQSGWHTELEADVELQSVAAPGAASITLVLSPAGEVYTSGVNELVSNLPQLTAVSVSFGLCEPAVVAQDGGIVPSAIEALISQGIAEGQTWFAASGDNGADDCGDGSGPAVDFPSSIPEIVAVGGTQAPVAFDSNDAIASYVQEVVWNDSGGPETGAGGGGTSSLFAKPSWQTGDAGGRDMPDLSLLSGTWLAVANGPGVGVVSQFAGTSGAAPLAAGMFALVSQAVGCRLGLVQPDLYEIGQRQLAGGAAIFHDIVTGNNSFNGVTGYAAAAGFDLASGWGSLDVAALAAAWPACPATGGFPIADAGPPIPYDPCPVCDAGLYCEAAGEGPASCVPACPTDAAGDGGPGGHCLANCLPDAGDCPKGRACQPLADVALCLPACQLDFDCGILPGTACDADSGVCLERPIEDAGPTASKEANGDGGESAVSGVGCGCQAGPTAPEAALLLGLLVVCRRRVKGFSAPRT